MEYIYDLHSAGRKPNGNEDIITRYDDRAIHWKKMLHLGILGLADAIMDRVKRR